MRQQRAILLAIAMACVLMTACGGDEPETASSEPAAESLTPQERLAAATQATNAAGSARLALEQVIKSPDIPGGELKTGGKGIFTLGAKQQGQMTLSLGQIGSFEMRADGTTFYYKYDAKLRQALNVPTPWVSATLKDISAAASEASQLNANPTAQLDLLNKVAQLKETGEEQLRGDNTTRYAGTLNLTKTLRELSPGARASLQQLTALGVSKVPIEVWIDDEDRMRQMTMDVSFSAQGKKATLHQTFELWDFGVKVPFERPPADQVTKIKDVPGLAEAFAGG